MSLVIYCPEPSTYFFIDINISLMCSISTHYLVSISIGGLKVCLFTCDLVNDFPVDWISVQFDMSPGFVCTVSTTVPYLRCQPFTDASAENGCPLKDHWWKEVRTWKSSNWWTDTETGSPLRKSFPSQGSLLAQCVRSELIFDISSFPFHYSPSVYSQLSWLTLLIECPQPELPFPMTRPSAHINIFHENVSSVHHLN